MKYGYLILALFFQMFLLGKDYVAKPVLGYTSYDFPHYENDRRGEQRIRISEEVEIVSKLYETSKGNGELSLYFKDKITLEIKIDSHDDGYYYKDGILSHAFVDIDGDGILELVLSGLAVYTPEQGDYILKQERIHRVYQYDLNKHEWNLLRGKTELCDFVPKPVMGLGKETVIKNKDVVSFFGSGEQSVKISDKVEVDIKINIPSQHEGALKIYQNEKETFSFKIYDYVMEVMSKEDEGVSSMYYYLDGLLNYCFVDIDGDNVLDMIISGTVVQAGDVKRIISLKYCYHSETNTWNLFEADKLMKKPTESELKK